MIRGKSSYYCYVCPTKFSKALLFASLRVKLSHGLVVLLAK